MSDQNSPSHDVDIPDNDRVVTPDDLAEDSFTVDTNSNGDPERGLPDPGFLLNMAAVQFDARALLNALVPIFDQYAWSAMGFIADPRTGDTNRDMAAAQLSIDTVQYLVSKIDTQLSETDRRDLHRRLSDLRMNYLAKLKEN
jgi:hypothetical protein